MTTKRLNKFLAHCGIASRRKAEELILSHMIKVNNKIVTLPQTLINTEKDIVKLNNKVIREEKKYYFILNKPKGYLCSNLRQKNEKIVIDLFKDFNCRLFTVGRLDKDTTGLIIVTNDGDFANSIIHPSSNLEKEYLANVKENITEDHLKKVSKGAFVENKYIKPLKVYKTKKRSLKILVKEGKKREVRVFIEKALLTLLSLQRVRIGRLKLPKLPVGYFLQTNLKDLKKYF